MSGWEQQIRRLPVAGGLEGVRGVGDGAVEECGFAGVAYACAAGPANGYVACFGELEDAAVGAVPADVQAGPDERDERAGPCCTFGCVRWPGPCAGRSRA